MLVTIVLRSGGHPELQPQAGSLFIDFVQEMWLAVVMTKWFVAMGILMVAMGALVWQLSSGAPAQIEITIADAAPTVAVAASDAGPGRSKPLANRHFDAGPAPVAMLDPQSEEFSDRVDVGIQDGFRSRLARCERDGLDPDAKIIITYTLHIEDGIVSASNVAVLKSDLNSAALEQCMVAAVQQSRWEASDMPDFKEDQELFIRLRSLSKYLPQEEQEAAKARDHVEPED